MYLEDSHRALLPFPSHHTARETPTAITTNPLSFHEGVAMSGHSVPGSRAPNESPDAGLSDTQLVTSSPARQRAMIAPIPLPPTRKMNETLKSHSARTGKADISSSPLPLPRLPVFTVIGAVPPARREIRPSYNFDVDKTVTLVVGLERRKMAVQTCYITRTSAFFATALKKKWAGGQAREIELPEEMTSTLRTTAFELLAELWVLGERRLNSVFRNAIIGEFIRLEPSSAHHSSCRTFRRDNFVNTIFRGTPAGSPARQLMVDQSLRVGCSECNSGAFDESLLYDLTQVFFAAMQRPGGVHGWRGLTLKTEEYHV